MNDRIDVDPQDLIDREAKDAAKVAVYEHGWSAEIETNSRKRPNGIQLGLFPGKRMNRNGYLIGA